MAISLPALRLEPRAVTLFADGLAFALGAADADAQIDTAGFVGRCGVAAGQHQPGKKSKHYKSCLEILLPTFGESFEKY